MKEEPHFKGKNSYIRICDAQVLAQIAIVKTHSIL